MIVASPVERSRFSEIPITPGFLKSDNSSPKVIHNRSEWRKAKEARNGQITLYIVCGDARIVTAEIFDGPKIVSIASIASSGDLEHFQHLLQHNYVGQIVVVGHFDHHKINQTGKMSGCGGVDSSRKLRRGEVVIENEELKTFLEQKVSPGFFSNVKRTVEQAGRLSGKPVLGVLVDHLTYAAFPIMELIGRRLIKYPEGYLLDFQRGQIENIDELLTIGGGAFPELKLEDLAPVFRRIITKNRVKARRRLEKDHGFIERQRVQNPSTVVISTCPIPVALRYPSIFGIPNEAFVIRKAFDKEEEEIKSTDIDFMSIVGQLYYPLKQADFSRTQNILIETPDLEMSAQIANRLLKIPFVQDWVKRRQGKIMIAKLEHHETKEIRYFSLTDTQ